MLVPLHGIHSRRFTQRPLLLGLLTVTLLLGAESARAGMVYRWVDAGGTVYYTDDPSSLPSHPSRRKRLRHCLPS